MSHDEKMILVVPSSPAGAAKGAKGLFDRTSPQAVSLQANRLKQNLSSFLESIHEMVSGLPKVSEPFALTEIELTVEVNSEGSVQLIGGMKVGASGGITLTLKR